MGKNLILVTLLLLFNFSFSVEAKEDKQKNLFTKGVKVAGYAIEIVCSSIVTQVIFTVEHIDKKSLPEYLLEAIEEKDSVKFFRNAPICVPVIGSLVHASRGLYKEIVKPLLKRIEKKKN